MFATELAAPEGGEAQLFFDMTGDGFSAPASGWMYLPPSEELRPYQLELPHGECRALRLDPINHAGTVTIGRTRILDPHGAEVHAFAPTDFRALHQIKDLVVQSDRVQVVPVAGANDPILTITLSEPLHLGASPAQAAVRFARTALMFFGGLLLATGIVSWLRPAIWNALPARWAMALGLVQAAAPSDGATTSHSASPASSGGIPPVRRRWRWSTAAAALLLATVVSLPFLPVFENSEKPFALEVDLRLQRRARVQLFRATDTAGFAEAHSAAVWQGATDDFVRNRFPLPEGRYRALRFDPANNDTVVEIRNARVVGPGGVVVKTFSPRAFQAQQQIAQLDVTGDVLRVVPTPGAIDPILNLRLEQPLDLFLPLGTRILALLRPAGITLAVIAFVLVVAGRLQRPDARGTPLERWVRRLRQRPQTTVALTAAVAAIASMYPVVFLGRSLVSPNFSDGTYLLYYRFPPVPGSTATQTEDAKGSDMGAIAWQNLPYSIIQHRAIFRDHELPLWNRYNSSGITLIGQGMSMLGDPLHVLVVLADGAVWAWDLKYLVARWLFAAGIGLLVWHATRFLPGAMLSAVSAAFVGFFVYRINHPAIFGFCYAPWVLLCWWRLVQAPPGWRNTTGWALALIATNGAVVTSGTAKEAYFLVLGMNFTGAVYLLAAALDWRDKLQRFAIAGAAGVVLVMLSAPLWITFLDALSFAFTFSDTPAALQINPGLALGLFDELFYRPINTLQRVWNPSANFLVLLGVLYAVATVRRMPFDRGKCALLLCIAGSVALLYGLVPPSLITAIPLIGRVWHFDNLISCVLIIQLLVLAGHGFHAAARRLGRAGGRGDLLIVAALFGTLVLLYVAFGHVTHREPYGKGTVISPWQPGESMEVHPFIWSSLAAMSLAGAGLALAARRALRQRSWSAAMVLVAVACVAVLLWRHGLHARIGPDDFVVSPPPRMPLREASPAIDVIQRAQAEEPWRVLGFDANLHAGWSSAYDLETISGPDPLHNRVYKQLLDAFGLLVPGAWEIHATTEELARRVKVFDFFNVKYYVDLHHNPEEISRTLRLVAQEDLNVYASDSAWPRAFFTDRLGEYVQPNELRQAVERGDGRPFAMAQAGDRPPGLNLDRDLKGRTVKPAHDYQLTSNRTRFRVAAPGPGIIVLQESWLPGDFRVSLNGRPTSYFRVNHAFKAVAVPAAGVYEVVFTYWPRRFTFALALAAAAAVALATIAIFLWRTRRRSTLERQQCARAPALTEA